jgi:hypothetical protein
MYLIGKGSDVMGPGTSTVQRIDWTRAQETQLMNAMRGRGPGLGCVGLGCLGLGSVPEFADDRRQMTRYRGMGCACRNGLGLFDSGLDFSGWGGVEWALVAIGGYVALSTVFTTQRASTRVRKSLNRYARRKAVAA